MRRLNFFDRHVVKQDGSDVHPGIQRLNVSCVCGGPEHLWLGDAAGEVRRLDRQSNLSAQLRSFDQELIGLSIARDGELLVAVGYDGGDANVAALYNKPGAPGNSGSGVAKYKVFDTRQGDGGPAAALVLAQNIFPGRGTPGIPTCVATAPGSLPTSSSTAPANLGFVAVGTQAGTVQLFRGQDLAQDKPWPTTLGAEDGNQPVTSVHFLEQANRTVLFACTADSVRSWSVLGPGSEKSQEIRQLNVDCSGGSAAYCSCVFPTINALLVARGDAVFSYDPVEGNMSAMPMEGDKAILEQFKSYFIAVTVDSGPSMPSTFGTSSAPPSSMPKQTVTICLAHPRMRFIAYSSQFTDVAHVVVGMGGVFILSRGGADGNTVLFELREKPLAERLDILVKKRMFEWASEVALKSDAAPEVTADIYRQHGDALFEKRAYDQALGIYMKTVDLGLPLEPSYVVERYLDAQRIGHVAQYLKKLHEKDMAEPEHTALLLKCYTKLKDFSTLEEFLENTPVSQYDSSTAIEVLEAAGYYGLAAAVAQKVNRNDDFVRISLDQFKSYGKTVEFLRSLDRQEACRILLAHGRPLMKLLPPSESIELVRHICGLQSKGGSEGQEPVKGAPSVDELVPVFVEDLHQLEVFLRSVLLAPAGCQLPPAEAERLFPTLLELLVRSHQALTESQDQSADNHEAASKLGSDIMRLVRQYPGEGALASTLMLCQTYSFVDGFFHAAERLHRFQLLMNWCFEHRDARRLLEVCKRCGSVDQSLWVQALSFLSADGGGHLEEIGEVLRHIEDSDLMPLLMVIETLKQSKDVTVGAVRPYLQAQFRRLEDSVETSRGKAAQDRTEIARMQQEIVQLRTQAKEFQNTRCFQCGLTLEVPAVHFFCGHSYHSYCVPAQDGSCPKCSSEALPKISLKEQREAQARNADDFFKYLQGGAGDRGVQAMGEWCKFGAFDAQNGSMADEED